MSAAPTANKQEYRKTMMLTEPVSKIIPKMAIPTIVAFIINSVYSLADTYFVSGLGEAATAAVSVNSSLDQFIMMGGSLFAVGANSYIARLLGAREEEKASRVLSVAFFLAAFFGLVILAFGSAFMTPMVRMLGATTSCEQHSIDYATYVLLVAPFMTTSFVMNQCLRAEGSATLSMIGMGFGGILNCFLDPIFINGFGSFEGMGVAGASLATAISKLVSFAILIFPYLTRRSVLRISLKYFKPTWQIIREIVSVGSSSMLRSGLAVISAIVLNNIIKGLPQETVNGVLQDTPTAVLAGIGVTTKVMMFPFSIILGFCTGFTPVAGFNWGARRCDRVRESYNFSAKVAIIGSVIMAVGLWVTADWIMSAFADGGEANRIGALSIRLQCLALPIHAWVALVNMLCSGLGRAKGALLLATARQGTCFLPIVHLLAFLFGANGIAAVQAVADILTLALAVPMIVSVMRLVRREEEKQLTAAAI